MSESGESDHDHDFFDRRFFDRKRTNYLKATLAIRAKIGSQKEPP
jgi:hypothetical protein